MILPTLDLLFPDGVVLLDLQARLDAEDLSPDSLPRWRQLLSDLARLRAGWRPEKAILVRAPRLTDWSITEPEAFGLVRLVGTVMHHPILQDNRVVATSPLVALDTRTLAWARTVSRFYVLGNVGKKT